MTNYNKNNPFYSKLLKRELVTKKGSNKKTYHIELDITNSNITYTPGDAIGVLPRNCQKEVDQILDLLQIDKDSTVVHPKTLAKLSIESYLLHHANITKLTGVFLEMVLTKNLSPKQQELKGLLLDENKQDKLHALQERSLLDWIIYLEVKTIDPQDLVSHLRTLLPRLYSIASSQQISSTKVDLLVAMVEYEKNGKIHYGLGSHFLCLDIEMEDKVPIYLHPSKFHPPSDPNTPLIMIGPGTGVAPYRGFLQERTQQRSKNWLFFGEQTRANDFYYEDFLTELEKKGQLKLSLAFSRDQEKKVYVQDLMQEQSQELYDWIMQGAAIYVCGDAKHMAKGVNETLHAILEKEGLMTKEKAKSFIKEMKKSNRYFLDVY